VIMAVTALGALQKRPKIQKANRKKNDAQL
jgi:hypothetical protein